MTSNLMRHHAKTSKHLRLLRNNHLISRIRQLYYIVLFLLLLNCVSRYSCLHIIIKIFSYFFSDNMIIEIFFLFCCLRPLRTMAFLRHSNIVITMAFSVLEIIMRYCIHSYFWSFEFFIGRDSQRFWCFFKHLLVTLAI